MYIVVGELKRPACGAFYSLSLYLFDCVYICGCAVCEMEYIRYIVYSAEIGERYRTAVEKRASSLPAYSTARANFALTSRLNLRRRNSLLYI